MVDAYITLGCEGSVFQNFSFLVFLGKAWEKEVIIVILGKLT